MTLTTNSSTDPPFPSTGPHHSIQDIQNQITLRFKQWKESAHNLQSELSTLLTADEHSPKEDTTSSMSLTLDQLKLEMDTLLASPTFAFSMSDLISLVDRVNQAMEKSICRMKGIPYETVEQKASPMESTVDTDILLQEESIRNMTLNEPSTPKSRQAPKNGEIATPQLEPLSQSTLALFGNVPLSQGLTIYGSPASPRTPVLQSELQTTLHRDSFSSVETPTLHHRMSSPPQTPADRESSLYRFIQEVSSEEYSLLPSSTQQKLSWNELAYAVAALNERFADKQFNQQSPSALDLCLGVSEIEEVLQMGVHWKVAVLGLVQLKRLVPIQSGLGEKMYRIV